MTDLPSNLHSPILFLPFTFPYPYLPSFSFVHSANLAFLHSISPISPSNSFHPIISFPSLSLPLHLHIFHHFPGPLIPLYPVTHTLITSFHQHSYHSSPPSQGSRGWEDLAHLDSAWVTIRLRDVNDNPPMFSRPHAHVTVQEDASPGTVLATMPARDPDMVRRPALGGVGDNV